MEYPSLNLQLHRHEVELARGNSDCSGVGGPAFYQS